MKKDTWAGEATDFPGEDIKLAFEGLRNRELLLAAGWQDLRSWVSAASLDLKEGRRAAP